MTKKLLFAFQSIENLKNGKMSTLNIVSPHHMLAKLLVTFRARKIYWILASNSMELPNDRNEQENAVEVTWSYENDVWLSTLDSNGMKCLLDINRFMIKSRNGVSIA